MLDLHGKKINTTIQITENLTTLSNFQASSGVYFVKILLSNGSIETHKIFIP